MRDVCSLPRGITWALVSLVATACTPLGVLNTFVPASGHVRSEGIAYGEGPRQRLDVYVPAARSSGRRPVVVFFYGGRWQSGDRSEYAFAAQALTSRGFVVVVPDYRLYPEVVFPAFVEDGAAAVAWTRENVDSFGGDPSRVFLMGHSAGAHIALLLALDASYLRPSGADATPIAGAVGLAGPYDFLPFTSADVRALMGPAPSWPATQPIHHADGSDPPVLLMHGLDDSLVKPKNAVNLASTLQADGGCAVVRLYREVGHVELLLGLAAPLDLFTPDVADAAAEFMRAPRRACGGAVDFEPHR